MQQNGQKEFSLKNNTGKTVISRVSQDKLTNNSFAIISERGTVAVTDPYKVSRNIKPDLITVSHTHYDHYDKKYIDAQTCRKSIARAEHFNVRDIGVKSIASTHRGNNIDPSNPRNVLYVFEVDGLRIAHMGDIGQDYLTDKQLEQLGNIDIAFVQFLNPWSGYSLKNQKGLKCIEQLKPQVIIPTHISFFISLPAKISFILDSGEGILKMLEEKIAPVEYLDRLAISKDDLKDKKRRVIQFRKC